ncbi:MAG: hypothetical protein KAV82_09355 [Phycisphaerae bacterium]|nr:hypothetical protein [Phycisphaerae bacterium]
MTLVRIVGLLLIFGSIALTVVCLRSEEARIARRIQDVQFELVKIRRELWSTQLAIARCKSPRRIDDEVTRRSLSLAAPSPPGPRPAEELRWANAR